MHDPDRLRYIIEWKYTDLDASHWRRLDGRLEGFEFIYEDAQIGCYDVRIRAKYPGRPLSKPSRVRTVCVGMPLSEYAAPEAPHDLDAVTDDEVELGSRSIDRKVGAEG